MDGSACVRGRQTPPVGVSVPPPAAQLESRGTCLGAGVPAFVLRPWQAGCGCRGCCGQLSWSPAIFLPLISLAPEDASDPLILSQPVGSARRRLWSPVFALHVVLSALIALEYESFFFLSPGCSSQHERAPAAFASCASPASLLLSNGRFCLFLVGNKSLSRSLSASLVPTLACFFQLSNDNEHDCFRFSTNQTEMQQRASDSVIKGEKKGSIFLIHSICFPLLLPCGVHRGSSRSQLPSGVRRRATLGEFPAHHRDTQRQTSFHVHGVFELTPTQTQRDASRAGQVVFPPASGLEAFRASSARVLIYSRIICADK